MFWSIALAALIACVALVVVRIGANRRLRRRLVDIVAETFPSDQIERVELPVKFLGQRSEGKHRPRGRGVLILTASEIWFRRSTTTMPVTIALESLTDIIEARQFMRRTSMSPLILATFRTSAGFDEAAWRVDRPQGWVHDITRLAIKAVK